MAKNYVDYEKLEELSNRDIDIDLREKSMKLAEECGEYQQAMLEFLNAGNSSHSVSGDSRENVLEELCDTINVAMDIINAMGFSTEKTSEMFDKKLNKWQAKRNK